MNKPLVSKDFYDERVKQIQRGEVQIWSMEYGVEVLGCYLDLTLSDSLEFLSLYIVDSSSLTLSRKAKAKFKNKDASSC